MDRATKTAERVEDDLRQAGVKDPRDVPDGDPRLDQINDSFDALSAAVEGGYIKQVVAKLKADHQTKLIEAMKAAGLI
jgi:hypothetical protein